MNITRWILIIIVIILIFWVFSWYLNEKEKQLETGTEFNCYKCGRCCYALQNVLQNKHKLNPEVLEMINEFPYSFDASGKCEKLINNQCSVYNNRPDICNLKTSWARAFSDKITLDNYFKLNHQYCERLANYDYNSITQNPYKKNVAAAW